MMRFYKQQSRGTNGVRKTTLRVDSACVESKGRQVRRNITKSGGQSRFV